MNKLTLTNQAETVLPEVDAPVRFTVYYRLHTTDDWEVEIVVDTKIKALHYVQNALSANGEFKIEADLDTDVLIGTNYKKETLVYQFKTHTPTLRGDEIIVITNSPSENELKALEVYHDCVRSGKPSHFKQNQAKAGLPYVEGMAVSPIWSFTLILERIAKIGGKFRIQQHKGLDDPELDMFLDQASFAFAESGTLTMFFVIDADDNVVTWDEFDSYLGMEFTNSKKSAKRFKELLRYTLFADVMSKPLVIHGVEVDPSLEKAVDGNGPISMSCFLRMVENISDPVVRSNERRKVLNGETTRVNFRYTFRDDISDVRGLIKGDKIIVKDSVLEAEYGYVPDLVEPMIDGSMVNLKPEICTDGTWHIMTASPHHPHHQPMTNDQILACVSKNGTWLFTPEVLKADHKALVDEVYTAIENGEFPAYMRADWMSSAKGREGGNINPDRLASRIQQLSVRYEAQRAIYSDSPLRESGFAIKMVGNQFSNRLKAAAYGKGKKILMPIGHAGYFHVTSMSTITLCGLDPEGDGFDTSKSFYYEKAHSWVEPDDVFIDTYARHGGKDGDDSEIVIVRKTYDTNLGESPENTVLRAVVVRMPCAWGEYSIQNIDVKDFPFYNDWNDMPTLDITKGVRPEFLEEMEQDIKGLTYSNVEVPTSYTRDWMKYQLQLAITNPGVGQFINPMIAFYATACTYFRVQLDSTENIVDCLMQTPDEDAFVLINGEIEAMKTAVLFSGIPIDSYIMETRMQGAKLPEGASTTKKSFYFEMMAYTKAAITEYGRRINRLSTHGRIPIAEVLAIDLPSTVNVIFGDGTEHEVDTMGHAVWVFNNFKKLNSNYPSNGTSEQRREFSGTLNRNICEYLLGQPNFNIMMVAIYKHIIKSNEKDNFLFQTPMESMEISTMDLWLHVLYSIGMASKIDANGKHSYMESIK